MFAASPGLHAVEHPIYDVWLTDCMAPVKVAEPAAPPPAAAPAPAARPPEQRKRQNARQQQPPPPVAPGTAPAPAQPR